MLPNELFEILKEYSNCNPKEVVETVSDLLENIEENADTFCSQLLDCLEEFAEYNSVCYQCGNDLIFQPTNEQEDCQGSPVGIYVCPNGCN